MNPLALASQLHARLTRRQWKLGLFSLIFFLTIKFIVSIVVMSSFSGLFVSLEIDQTDRFVAYYSVGPQAAYSEKRIVASSEIPAGKRTEAGFPLNGKIARKLRIDPGSQTNRVKLYGIRLESNYGSPIILDATQIYRHFEANEDIADYTLAGDTLSFNIAGSDPQLLIKDELVLDSGFFQWIFPAILTFVAFLLLRSFRWREFPAFADLKRDLTTTHINYGALDGIRGIAVLLVLADHSLPAFIGSGTAGVWIFFVLSGFLLTIPFVAQPERAVSPQYMGEYLLRRLKRIIPMYYVYVFIVFFLYGNFSSGAIRHFLFLQGDGHLWTIQQEMLFYLALPLIVVINHLVFRGRAIFIVIALFTLMLAANTWLGKSVLTLHSVSVDHRAYAGIFITGMAFSYLYHGVILQHKIAWLTSPRFKFWASIAGFTILACFILYSSDTLFRNGYYPPINVPGRFGIAAGIIILLALMTSGHWFNKLLALTPLRAIGLVGYSFYLIHVVVISLVTNMWDYYFGYSIGPGTRFVLVLTLTYAVAALTYTYIERPFLKRTQ